MRTIKQLTSAILVILCVYLSSCNKADLSKKDSLTLTSNDNVAVDLSGCKLRRIWSDYGTGLLTYNSKGNPIKLVWENNGTGNPDHYFFYDNQNRLIEWRNTYHDGTTVALRHRYAYNAAGVAIRDTVMAVEGDTLTFVHTFTYDPQGRIVKENIKQIYSSEGGPFDPQRNPTYTYDARGNLATAGWKSSWYDNKVNPLRTNPVFQFIFKNWSQNNAAVQPKYNSKGLPLSLSPNNDEFFNSQIATKLIYDCQ